MSRWRTIGRTATVIAGIAVLGGCQGVRDYFPWSGEKPPARDEAAAAPPRTEPRNPAQHETVRLDRATVSRLQERLASLGFRPGPVDGILGPRTRGAIRRYQTAHHLPATGKTSPRFLRHIAARPGRRKTAEDAAAPAGRENEKTTEDAAAHLGAEDLPTYQPGTTFIYADGDTEQVSATKGPMVEWVRGDRTTYTAHRNFLLPWSHWTSGDERGTAESSEAGDRLWPRRESAEVQFTAKLLIQRRSDPDLTERRVEQWHCRNHGRRELSVDAGTFETVVLVCRREAGSGAPEIVRTWYYARSVRHYVRFVESDPEGTELRRVDLVAVRPGAPGWPPIMRAALARALVHALETEEDEPRLPWASSGVDTRVTIEAKSRFVADDGRTCRRFVQIWSKNGERRHYPGMACRIAPGRWRIPGLTGSTAKALATSGELS